MEGTKARELLEQIEQVFQKDSLSEADFARVREFAQSRDPQARVLVAEGLAWFPGDESQAVLTGLLQDEEELVRTNACDSLFFSNSREVAETLQAMAAGDGSALVRGYAVLSLADIACNRGIEAEKREVAQFLIALLGETGDPWMRVQFYSALCGLGNREYFNPLLECVNDDDYHVRIAAARSIEDLAEQTDRQKGKRVLEARLAREDVYSVQCTLADVLKTLSGIGERDNKPG
jgi:HEAT repeat protein